MKTGLKKFFKYAGLGSVAAFLSVLVGIAGVDAAVPDIMYQGGSAQVAQSLPSNASRLLQVGMEHYQLGQFAAAVTEWQQAADAFATQGDRLNQSMVLSNLALAEHQLGKWTEANRAIATSLQLLQQEGGSADRLQVLAQALNTQGKLQLAQGQAEQALATWQTATETYQQVGDKTGVIRSLINQAQALRVLGFYQRVNTTLEQVSKILQDQPDSAIKAAGLLSFGDALRLVGNLKKSQEVLQQSLDIAQRLQFPSAMTAALLSLGNTAYAQQQWETAFNNYQQAIADSTSPLPKIQAQLNQLRLFIDSEKWPEAQALWPKIQPQLDSLPVSRAAIYAKINFTQSSIKLGSRKLGQGEVFQIAAETLKISVKQAQELGDRRAESYALGYLGQIHEHNQQWSKAQTLTEQALNLSQSSNASDVAYLWQWQLGRLLKEQDRTQGAIAAYQEAIKTLNSIRNDLIATNADVQFSFRESVEPVYRQLVGLLLQPNTNQTSQENLKQAREVIESLQLAELDNFFREACLSAKPKQIDLVDPQAAVIYPIILPDRLEVVLSLPTPNLPKSNSLRVYSYSHPND